jgi:hypothetical protein
MLGSGSPHSSDDQELPTGLTLGELWVQVACLACFGVLVQTAFGTSQYGRRPIPFSVAHRNVVLAAQALIHVVIFMGFVALTPTGRRGLLTACTWYASTLWLWLSGPLFMLGLATFLLRRIRLPPLQAMLTAVFCPALGTVLAIALRYNIDGYITNYWRLGLFD